MFRSSVIYFPNVLLYWYRWLLIVKVLTLRSQSGYSLKSVSAQPPGVVCENAHGAAPPFLWFLCCPRLHPCRIWPFRMFLSTVIPPGPPSLEHQYGRPVPWFAWLLVLPRQRPPPGVPAPLSPHLTCTLPLLGLNQLSFLWVPSISHSIPFLVFKTLS